MNDNGVRQHVLEATMRKLGATRELNPADVAFIKALDITNLTLAALDDIPEYDDDGLPQPNPLPGSRCAQRFASGSSVQARCTGATAAFRLALMSSSRRWRQPSTSRCGGLARRHGEGCDGIFACLQQLAVTANKAGRLSTIIPADFLYVDDFEAKRLLGPLALRSLAGITKKHVSLLHGINIDGARVRCVALAVAEVLDFADGWTLVCLYGWGSRQVQAPSACRFCGRRAFGRALRSPMQTVMTLFEDAGLTYTSEWLTTLCNDLQGHFDRKDEAFVAAEAKGIPVFVRPGEEPEPAAKPAKPAKPAKAERSPFCDSLSFAGATVRLCTVLLVRSALRRRSLRPSRAMSGSTSSASRSSPKRASGPDAEGLPHKW
jgi:hypothetical protein